jgi:hypothetical protein
LGLFNVHFSFLSFTKGGSDPRSGDRGTDVMARCIQSTSDHRRETAMLREVVPLIHQVTQQECEFGRWQGEIFDPTA